MIEQDLLRISSQVGEILLKNQLTIATAESCTGGLLSHILTGVSGSSDYFIGGIVAYSNRIKESHLGVNPITLETYGAVSSPTAAEMANGVRERFQTDIGLSTTGIAGPTGGTVEKPVGLVWIGISSPQGTQTYECHFSGGRNQVKTSTVETVLQNLLDELHKQNERKEDCDDRKNK